MTAPISNEPTTTRLHHYAGHYSQIRAIKGSIGHVEVFQMDGVAISIIGRPRPLPGHDTPNAAHNTYTLKYEEPDFGCLGHGRDDLQ